MPHLALNGGRPVRKRKFPAYRVVGGQEKRAVNRVIDSGVLSKYLGVWHPDFYGGEEVRAFEREWAAYFGAKHAIAVNSCTSALQCAVGAAGIGPGDEVIVSPFTMVASVTAPLWYGAIPIFADIEEEYFCLDPRSVEQRITERTKAIIVVDLFGQPYDRDAINGIAQKHNLTVIEDCAQAPGATYQGRWAGTLGHMGVYSLNYHKHIHTGEGGMIVTNDDQRAEKLQLIRNHAEAVVEEKGVSDLVNMVGGNFRLTELQAAIGRIQLTKLKKLLQLRVKNCEYLAERLTIPGIRSPGVRKDCTHVYYVQPLLYDEEKIGVSRDRFVEAVRAELPATELREQEGAQISGGYVKPAYLLPLFQKKTAIGDKGFPFIQESYRGEVSYAKGLCPVAERMYEKELIIHEFMRPPAKLRDLNDVITAFQKVYAHRSEIPAE